MDAATYGDHRQPQGQRDVHPCVAVDDRAPPHVQPPCLLPPRARQGGHPPLHHQAEQGGRGACGPWGRGGRPRPREEAHPPEPHGGLQEGRLGHAVPKVL